MPNYQEQYQRAKRYYERFKRINDGLASTCKICLDCNNMEDDVRSFFIHCYHVHDWIKNDSDAPDCMKERVYPFIKGNESTRICADLCNGIKHLKRTRKIESPSQPNFSGRDFKVEMEENVRVNNGIRVNSESISEPSPIESGDEKESSAVVIAIKFKVKIGEETRDAFTVATQAMELWETFIRENGGDC